MMDESSDHVLLDRSQTYKRRTRTDWLGSLLRHHGYHFVALDVRGTGQSSGVTTDEYTPQETADTLCVARYIAAQPWSDGRVVMYGFSYSTRAALEVLVYQCEQQKLLHSPHTSFPIVSAFLQHGPDDRWENDVHFWGGVKTVTDWLQYATAMVAFNMLPRYDVEPQAHFKRDERARPLDPSDRTQTDDDKQGDACPSRTDSCTTDTRSDKDPNVSQDSDQKTNKSDRRLDTLPWLFHWTTRDPRYWRRGQISAAAAAVQAPIFVYGGFHDLYIDAAVRLHQLWPRNVTVCGQSGHVKKWSTHDAWLLWWLAHYAQVDGQRLFWLPQQSDASSAGRSAHGGYGHSSMGPNLRDIVAPQAWVQHGRRLRERQVTMEWSAPTFGVVPLDLVYGPIMRYAAQAVCESAYPLHQQLQERALAMPLRTPDVYDASDTPWTLIAGAPRVRVELAPVPEPHADLYLVAWWLDDAQGALLSMGVQRECKCKAGSTLDIVMAPVCVDPAVLHRSTLYLTTSNVPNLVPQFGLRQPPAMRRCDLYVQVTRNIFGLSI